MLLWAAPYQSWSAPVEGNDKLAQLAKHAGAALAAKDFAVAEQDYRAILAIEPDLAEIRSNLGIALHMQGKYPQAEQEFRTAARVNSSLFVPNYFLGLQLFKTNRYPEARSFFEAALALNPSDVQIRNWLAATWVGLRDYDRAIATYREILSHDPKSVDALYAIGKIYIDRMGRSIKAISEGPKNIDYGLLLIDSLAGDTQWRTLVDTKLTPILRDNPSALGLRVGLGLVKLRNRDFDGADRLLQEEIAVDPWSFRAYYGLAQGSLASGKVDAFAAALEKAVTIRPEYFCPAPALDAEVPRGELETALQQSADPLASQFLAAQLGSQNTLCDSVAPYKERLQPAGKSTEALFREKRYETVISRLQAKSKLTNGDRWLLAQAYFGTGDFERAAKSASAVVRTPDSRSSPHLLSKSYQKLALEALAGIGKIAPDSYRVHQLTAEAHLARQSTREAIIEFKAAVDLQPDDSELLFQLGRACYSISDFSEAIHYIEKSLEIEPLNADGNLTLGKAFAQTGEFARAASSFERALQFDSSMVSARVELGKVYVRVKEWKKAVESLQLAVSADFAGELYYELFRAYSGLNEKEKAQEALAASKKRREEKLVRDRARLESGGQPN